MNEQLREQAVGYDSFLDIVANIVGILLILVLVVGVRVRRFSPTQELFNPEKSTLLQELEKKATRLAALKRDVLETGEQLQHLEAQIRLSQLERDRLMLAASLWDRKLQEDLASLQGVNQQDARLLLQIEESQREKESLIRSIESLKARQHGVVKLINYPTPLAKEVTAAELHFQLRAGCIAAIPLERLVKLAVSDARRKLQTAIASGEVQDTVGPVDGFRAEYLAKLYAVPDRSSAGQQRTIQMGRVERLVLMPTSYRLGETVAEALQPGSQFRKRLEAHSPREAVVTIWVYPDSFSEFNQVRNFLHEQGFSCAGRPLPFGVPIGFSAQGSRSLAE